MLHACSCLHYLLPGILPLPVFSLRRGFYFYILIAGRRNMFLELPVLLSTAFCKQSNEMLFQCLCLQTNHCLINFVQARGMLPKQADRSSSPAPATVCLSANVSPHTGRGCWHRR